jgi:hypothetical protein
MTNYNINAGGIIGGFVAAGSVIAFLVLNQGRLPRHSGRLIGFAILGGAFAGNLLWSKVFGDFSPSDDDLAAETETVAEADAIVDEA